jgi:drug/metabolite transporter (DMT)-like permease
MQSIERLSPLFVVIAAALWGIDGIILRPALYGLPVALVVLVESSIVAILMTPILFQKFSELNKLESFDWFIFLAIALFGGAIGTMAITKALFYVNFVNLSIVIFIQKLQPVFALILAALLLRERLPLIFLFWSGLAILGAYLITFGVKMPIIQTGNKTVIAALFSLLAAVSFAASTVLSKRGLRNVTFQMGTYLRFLMTSIIMFTIISITGDLSDFPNINGKQFLIFLLIAFTTGGTAIYLYYFGLKRISASVATICELAFPLTAVILEYFVRDNFLDLFQWLGVAILLISIYRVTKIDIKPLRSR